MKDVISEITPGRDDDDIFLPPATTTARTLNKFQPKPRGKPNKPITAASHPFAVTSNAGARARAGAGQEEAFLTEKGNPGQDAPVAECTESIVAPISEPSSAVAPIAGSSNLALAEEAAHVMGAPEVDTEVPAVFDMEDDLLVDPSGPTGLLNGLSSTERAVGKFRPKRHPKTTKLIPSFSNSDDNTLQHASPTEDIEASKLGSVSCEPVGFSSQDIETQESLSITKGSSTHEGNCQDGPQVFENKNNLQTDPDRPEEEAIPVLSGMESHDGLFSQSSDAAGIKGIAGNLALNARNTAAILPLQGVLNVVADDTVPAAGDGLMGNEEDGGSNDIISTAAVNGFNDHMDESDDANQIDVGVAAEDNTLADGGGLVGEDLESGAVSYHFC